MNKILAIYFSDPEPMGYPFHKSQYYERYKRIAGEVVEKGIDVYFVRGNSYLGEGVFKKGWYFDGDELLEKNESVQANLIFNRDDKNTIPEIQDCPIINAPEFDSLCVDKAKTYEAFPDISPKTSVVNSYADAMNLVHNWNLEPDELIVLKKNFETEGRGIFVITLDRIEEDLYTDWQDILVQEFVDSSCGIPGLVKGMHDLRVTVVNGTPINSFLRVPKEGSYLANISQGGSGQSIDFEDVPKQVLEYVATISEAVSNYLPNIFAADFMNSPKGYKLIELNSRPGVQHPDWSPTYRLFNDAIINMLVNATRDV